MRRRLNEKLKWKRKKTGGVKMMRGKWWQSLQSRENRIQKWQITDDIYVPTEKEHHLCSAQEKTKQGKLTVLKMLFDHIKEVNQVTRLNVFHSVERDVESLALWRSLIQVLTRAILLSSWNWVSPSHLSGDSVSVLHSQWKWYSTRTAEQKTKQ